VHVGKPKAKHFQLFLPSTSCCSVCLRTSKSLSVGKFDKCLKYTKNTYYLLANDHHLYQVLSLNHVFLCSLRQLGLSNRKSEELTKRRSRPSIGRSFLKQGWIRTREELCGYMPTSIVPKSSLIGGAQRQSCSRSRTRVNLEEKLRQKGLNDEMTRSTTRRVPDGWSQ